MTDAHEELIASGYRPEYTGDTSLGDVGPADEVGANLYYLYRAGRNELPALAAKYSRLTYQIYYLRHAMEAQFSRPGMGREEAHDRLLVLREEAHFVLRTTCLRMLEVGQALVRIADAYAATDQQAANDFAQLLEENRADYDERPVEVRVPPGAHDRFHDPINLRTQ